jgi:hypothetical protein
MSTGYDNAYPTYGVHEVEISTRRLTFGRIPNAKHILGELYRDPQDLQCNQLTKI